MMADNRQNLGLLGRSEQAMERGIVVLMCCWEVKCGEPEIQGSGWPGWGGGGGDKTKTRKRGCTGDGQ
jgi:hypothetical protein